jgi:hypothetical protein
MILRENAAWHKPQMVSIAILSGIHCSVSIGEKFTLFSQQNFVQILHPFTLDGEIRTTSTLLRDAPRENAIDKALAHGDKCCTIEKMLARYTLWALISTERVRYRQCATSFTINTGG